MDHARKIDDRHTVGLNSPTAATVTALMRSGYRSLVNLRCEEQESQPRTPHAEGEIAREAGIRYVHFPVSSAPFGTASVTAFRREIQSLPMPVYLHCTSGKRASAFAMMHIAAEEVGFGSGAPEMTRFVCAYVESHRG